MQQDAEGPLSATRTCSSHAAADSSRSRANSRSCCAMAAAKLCISGWEGVISAVNSQGERGDQYIVQDPNQTFGIGDETTWRGPETEQAEELYFICLSLQFTDSLTTISMRCLAFYCISHSSLNHTDRRSSLRPTYTDRASEHLRGVTEHQQQ